MFEAHLSILCIVPDLQPIEYCVNLSEVALLVAEVYIRAAGFTPKANLGVRCARSARKRVLDLVPRRALSASPFQSLLSNLLLFVTHIRRVISIH